MGYEFHGRKHFLSEPRVYKVTCNMPPHLMTCSRMIYSCLSVRYKLNEGVIHLIKGVLSYKGVIYIIITMHTLCNAILGIRI